MFISLLMPSILHAMTMVSIEVQLMAFKFLELVVQHYPDSLFMCHEVVSQILALNIFALCLIIYLFFRILLILENGLGLHPAI